jgi:3-oxoacyl-[acyl-carrier protein] reductase
VIQMVKQIAKRHGHLDAVINNAGVAAMNPALLMPLTTARKIMETNFLAAFVVARESAKVMMPRKYGRIVNLSSVAVPMCLEGESVYAAAKAALEQFTKVFAHEVGPYGITVNAVGPSPVLTDLIRNVPQEKIDALVQRLAIKRRGTLQDVTRVVDFFLSPGSDYITGQIIYLGGAS